MPKIYIASVEAVASGVKNNRKWSIYAVTDQTGKRYKTFEEKYLALKEQEIEVTLEERPSKKINPKTNSPYIDTWIVEPKRAQIKLDDILMMINDLRERVEELEKGRGASLGQAVKTMKSEVRPEGLDF